MTAPVALSPPADARETDVPGTPPPGGLRGRVVSGVAWKFTSQAFRQGSRLIVALILARLLTPTQFGIAAEVLVFSSFIVVFADAAFGAALVQRETVTEDDRSTAFWSSVAIGALLTVVGFLLAGPVAAFYGEPEVEPLLRAMSAGFLLTSVGAIQEALLVREMDFRTLELRLMLATLLAAFVGIGAALAGWGAWAIILQSLTTIVASSVILWVRSEWRPSLRFSMESFKSMGAFSAYIFGHRFLYYAHRNADNLLIGKFLGPASLGAYAIAYNIILVPFSRIAVPIQDVLFPALARVQNDLSRVADAWIRAMRMVGAVTVPGLAGLAVVAPEFVEVVLGSKWSSAVPIIQILSWVGILQALQSLNTGVLEAVGRARAVFRWTLVFFASHIVAFVIGLHWGIVGVAVGYAVSTTLIEPSYLWLTCRAVNTSPWKVLRGIAGVLQASAIMAVAVLAVRNGLNDNGVSALPCLVLCTLTGMVTYPLLLWWRSPETVADARGLIRRRRGGSADPVEAGAVA